MRVLFMLTPPVSRVNPSYFCDKPRLVPCALSCRTYTRFRGRTRVPPVTNLVLLMRLAVVMVPASCSPPHGGRPRGRPARDSGRGGGARDPLCLVLKRGGRVQKL